MDPHYPEVIKECKEAIRQCVETLVGTQGMPFRKTRDHEKEFMASIMPNSLQEYVLYESHISLGHYGITRQYQFLKITGKVKRSLLSVCEALSSVPNNKFADPKLCSTPPSNPQMLMNFISMDLAGPFQITTRGIQYTLILICMLTYYVMNIPLVDTSANTVVNQYLK